MNLTVGTTTCTFTASTTGNNGNVYEIENKLDENRTQNFAYDALNRITQGYSNGTNWGQAFTTDPWGNLTNISAVSGKTIPAGLNAAPATLQNRLPGYSYDLAGNLISDGTGHNFQYDAENRIKAGGGVTYTYDGEGNRVMKSSGTMYWTGLSGETLSESNLTGTISADYVFFYGKRVARVDRPSNKLHYFITDHLGSSRFLLTPATTTTWTVEQDLDYTPYGVVVGNVAAADHNEFTGKERDTESGLDNFGARYDASSVGRFMTPDPLGGKLVDPQTLNKYSYVQNNPINLTDPTGLYICADSKDCSSNQDKKFEAARQADLNRGGDAARAAGAYGDPTKDNGVNVSFADLSKDSERGSTTSSLGADANGFRANSNVVIDSAASGDKLEAVVGHEGTHAADAQDFVKSITPDGHGDFKVGQDITQYQTEQRAYHVSDSILRSGNQSEKYQCGVSECVLGVGLKNLGQVTAEVDRILQHNYKSSVNKQPLSPTNQGGSVVPLAVVPH